MNLIQELKLELTKAIESLKGTDKGEKFESYEYSPEQLNIPEFKEGGKVEVIAADGSLSVAPDGDYKLSDGREFTVKNGVIDSIVADNSAEDMADEGGDAAGDEAVTPSLEDVAAQVQALQGEVDGIKQILEQLIQQISGAASQEEMSKFSGEIKSLATTIQKLAKIPVETTKTSTSNKVKDKNDEKVMDFIRSFKKQPAN